MKELIHIHNQGPELRADSREIASLFGVEHESLRLIIDRYSNELEQFGHLRFEIGGGKKRPQGGGTPEKFAWLNFDQIALLLTLTRTTKETLPLRVGLLTAFKTAREKQRPIDAALLTIPDTWRRAFERDFYVALMALYKAEFEEGKNTPQWVGAWTLKFIYRPLYEKLPEELKKRRRLHAVEMGTTEWQKLHQFIEKHAKENLKKHLAQVTILLETCPTRQDFYERFAAKFYGQKQALLEFAQDVPGYEVDKGKFFDTLKRAARPTEKPDAGTSELPTSGD